MKKFKGIAVLSLFVAFAMTLPVMNAATLPVMNAAADGYEVPVEKKWTILMYCGADNDLEIATDFAIDQTIKALNEIDGDSADVNIVVLLDRKSTEGTWIYELTKDGRKPAVGWSDSERNTSDPSVMMEFLDFALTNYPAEKTMLVVKNGHAWCGVCPDWTEGNEKYLMSIDSLGNVLQSFKDEGKGIDVLALDGDNMASIEVAYELRNAIDYFIASQQDMPLDGLPYYLITKELVKNPDMTPARLAERIVYNYVLYYNNTDGKKILLDHLLSNSQMAVTASAFDMSKVGPIGDAFVALIDYMVGTEDWIPYNRPNISSARDCALIGKMGDQASYEWLPDVYQWFVSLEQFINYEDSENDVKLTVLVDNFRTVFDAAVVKMEQSQILNRSGNSFPHGLNIWFPPTAIHWDEFDQTRTRTYLYDGSNTPLPAEYYCVDYPYDYDACGLDFVDGDYNSWMSFFEIYYDSRWIINNSGQADDPVGPHPQE